jgi:hypothetical protein
VGQRAKGEMQRLHGFNSLKKRKETGSSEETTLSLVTSAPNPRRI